MARSGNKLTVEQIRALPTPSRTTLHNDGNGLNIQTNPSGGKSFLLRYSFKGRERSMGLGKFDERDGKGSLAAARKAAADALAKVADGLDPLEIRRVQRAAEAPTSLRSFKEVAGQYLATHEESWRNPVHRAQWRSTLRDYVFPHIGDLDVQAVDVGHVKAILRPIWTKIPETARRVRGRIQSIIDFATAHEYRRGDNPARLEIVGQVLVKSDRTVESHPAMPYDRLPVFMMKLRNRPSVSDRAIEWLILTATRSMEARGARWDEITTHRAIYENGVQKYLDAWRIPKERMKANADHVVPLSNAALELLADMRKRRSSDFIFPGGSEKSPISDTAMRNALRDMGVKAGDATLHGMRSSFRDWCADIDKTPDSVAEAALAHTVKDKTVAAYKRTRYFADRAPLMQRWATYLG